MIYGSFGGNIWLHLISILILILILSICMEPPTVVVPLGVVGDSVDLLVLPLLAGQGQVHVKVPTVVPVHLSLRLGFFIIIQATGEGSFEEVERLFCVYWEEGGF